MRLIDADYYCKVNGCSPPYGDALECANCCICDCPTVEAEPVRHGRWIEKQTTIQCSNCGKEYSDEIRCMCYGEDAELNHCPRCGATMKEKE